MKLFKNIDNDFIISLSTNFGKIEINQSEYNTIMQKIQNKPSDPDGYQHKLRADTLEWELVELPPIDDTDDEATESDYIEALQDLGVEVDG